MVGGLTDLGMSRVRHEVHLYLNTSEAKPYIGSAPDNSYFLRKRVKGFLGVGSVPHVTQISLNR